MAGFLISSDSDLDDSILYEDLLGESDALPNDDDSGAHASSTTAPAVQSAHSHTTFSNIGSAPPATHSGPAASPQQPQQPVVNPHIMEISGTDVNTAGDALIAASGDSERAIQIIVGSGCCAQL